MISTRAREVEITTLLAHLNGTIEVDQFINAYVEALTHLGNLLILSNRLDDATTLYDRAAELRRSGAPAKKDQEAGKN